MFKKYRKSVALLVVCMMLIASISACRAESEPADTPGETDTQQPADTPAEPDTEDEQEIEQELTTLRIFTIANTGITVPGIQDDMVAQRIKEDTGIIMDIENVEGVMIGQRISAMMAADDLPDIFAYDNDAELRQSLIRTGLGLDITDLAEEGLYNWWNNEQLNFVLNFSKEFLSDGTGRLFNIPVNNGMNNSPTNLTVGAYLRWDLYSELGYPEVNDIMDVVPVLEAMVERWPETADGRPTYGAGFWVDWLMWPVMVFGFIDGYAEGDDYLGSICIQTEEFISLLDDRSPFWKYTRFYNAIYQAGILHPDSFIMNFVDWDAVVTSGQVYFFINGWMKDNWVGEPHQGFGLIDTTGDSQKSYPIWGQEVGYSYMISSRSQVPERAIDFFNYLALESSIKMLHNGLEGVVWNYDENGKPNLILDVWERVSDMTNPARFNYGIKYSNLAPIAGGMKCSNGFYFNFTFDYEFAALTMTEVDRANAAFYGVTIPSEIYTRKPYTFYGNLVTAGMPAIDDHEHQVALNNIQNYINDNWINMIIADDWEAARETFTNDLLAMGFEEVLERFLEVYHEYRDRINALR